MWKSVIPNFDIATDLQGWVTNDDMLGPGSTLGHLAMVLSLLVRLPYVRVDRVSQRGADTPIHDDRSRAGHLAEDVPQDDDEAAHGDR